MIKEMRQKFNANFTKEKYDVYMAKLEALHPGALPGAHVQRANASRRRRPLRRREDHVVAGVE